MAAVGHEDEFPQTAERPLSAQSEDWFALDHLKKTASPVPWAQRRDQSACPAGMNWKSSTGTCSKNAWCSLCGNGHKTGVGCWLVYQFLHPPTHTVPGKAAPRRARNFSVAGTVGETTARRARASAMS